MEGQAAGIPPACIKRKFKSRLARGSLLGSPPGQNFNSVCHSLKTQQAFSSGQFKNPQEFRDR